MKTSIFSLLMLLSCIIYAQQPPYTYMYTPLSSFNKDTIAYLKNNFEIQSNYFKGKKVEEVLKYYEKDLPINIVYTIGTSPSIDPKGKSYMKTISITFYHDDYYLSVIGNPAISLIVLKINLVKPWLDEGEYWRNMPDFDTDREEAWYMKDLIVDNIKVRQMTQ